MITDLYVQHQVSAEVLCSYSTTIYTQWRLLFSVSHDGSIPICLGSDCCPTSLFVNKSAKALREEYLGCYTRVAINLSVFAEPEKEDKCYLIAEQVLRGLLLSLSFAQNLTSSILILCVLQISEQIERHHSRQQYPKLHTCQAHQFRPQQAKPLRWLGNLHNKTFQILYGINI